MAHCRKIYPNNCFKLVFIFEGAGGELRRGEVRTIVKKRGKVFLCYSEKEKRDWEWRTLPCLSTHPIYWQNITIYMHKCTFDYFQDTGMELEYRHMSLLLIIAVHPNPPKYNWHLFFHVQFTDVTLFSCNIPYMHIVLVFVILKYVLLS